MGSDKEIQLVAVNDTATAKKMLSRIINASKYSTRWISLETGPELRSAVEGNLVRLYSLYPDGYRDYVIHKKSINISGKFDFDCREYDARIYDDATIADPVEPVEDTTTVNGPTAIPYAYEHKDGTVQNIELTPNEISGYDVCGMFNGVTTASMIMHRFTAVRKFSLPVGLTGSYFKATTAATASTVFTIKKNSTTIGTATFAAAGTTATLSFSTAITFAAGDIFYVYAPTTPDATLADFTWTFVGVKESEWQS